MEKDPLTGAAGRSAVGQGLRRRPAHQQAREFLLALPGQALGLQKLYAARADKGLKTPGRGRHGRHVHPHAPSISTRAPSSIDTPLHSFIPASTSITCTRTRSSRSPRRKNCEKLTKEIFGGEMAYVPWLRPGFELGLAMQEIVQAATRSAKAIMMGQHGFISWADDDKECYDLTLDLIEKAAAYIEAKYAAKGGDATAFGGAKYADARRRPAPRDASPPSCPGCAARFRQQKRFIGTVQDDEKILRFVNSHDAAAPGRTRHELPRPFPAHQDQAALRRLESADRRRRRAQEQARRRPRSSTARTTPPTTRSCKHANSPAMRDPNPTVVLIPGLGMIAWGKDKSESRVTAEFYNCAVEVMRGAEAIDEYIALPQQEAFDIEYWLLEEAKLQRMPAEKELARQVIVVIGAGSGIGKETAHRLVKEGAHIVCVDLNEDAAEATAKEITDKYGIGIGVAGTGISGCGPAIGLAGQHHRPRQHPRDARPGRARLRRLRLASASPPASSCRATPPATSPTTNGRSPSPSTSPAATSSPTKPPRRGRSRGCAATSSSPPAPTPPSRRKAALAYDTSKAAANHLVRELAIELAPLVRVNGVAPATVVQGSAMFPRDRVIGSLAKYDIPYTDDEATESLVTKLAQFYADRTLTKIADHARRPGGGVLPARQRAPQQDHRPGHHRGRRAARGVPALSSRVLVSPSHSS